MDQESERPGDIGQRLGDRVRVPALEGGLELDPLLAREAPEHIHAELAVHYEAQDASGLRRQRGCDGWNAYENGEVLRRGQDVAEACKAFRDAVNDADAETSGSARLRGWRLVLAGVERHARLGRSGREWRLRHIRDGLVKCLRES
jgi:hypothetical protein